MKYGTLKINEDVVVPRSKVPELVAKIEQIGKSTTHSSPTSATPATATSTSISSSTATTPTPSPGPANASPKHFSFRSNSAARSPASTASATSKSQYMHYAIDKPTLEDHEGDQESL